MRHLILPEFVTDGFRIFQVLAITSPVIDQHVRVQHLTADAWVEIPPDRVMFVEIGQPHILMLHPDDFYRAYKEVTIHD